MFKNLELVHPDLVLIHQTAHPVILVKYQVSCGARTFEKQLECYLNKTSELDPRIPDKLKSAMHVITPYRPKAMATDIFIVEKLEGRNLMYDNSHLIYVVAYLIATADMLYSQGKITHKLKWGGNWDNDGIIQYDQNFDDNPHVQLYKP